MQAADDWAGTGGNDSCFGGWSLSRTTLGLYVPLQRAQGIVNLRYNLILQSREKQYGHLVNARDCRVTGPDLVA